MELPASQSVETTLELAQGTCSLSYAVLDVQRIIKSVGDDGAGATAVFIGTTRNSFEGRVVKRLEYQAYSKLAIKTIADIISNAGKSETVTPGMTNGATRMIRFIQEFASEAHYVVEVIAVSSPHRKEAFVLCEHILEEVKCKAQIWKREYYEGENEDDAQWKENFAPV